MPRKGENIYKRKDGRWEGRYIRSYDSEHKAKYAYVYGKTYSEVKRKLTEQRGNVQKVQPTKNKSSTYGELLDCWLHSMQLNTKESTQARYTHLIKTHIKPHLGAVQLSQLTTDAFPVIGGPSVGKTCFINMAIDQMMSDVAPARSWEMSFISDTEEKDHALAMKSLNQGVRLMKTELNSLTAYQLMLKLPNEKIGRRIYVYDISGEMFSSSSDVQNNLAYSYANGFIFIIDPLTLNQFAMDVEDKVDLNAYGASSKDFEDILNIMLINLEKMFGLKDKDTLKRNLAVVINKVDIPTLEEKIGEIAAQQYLAENAETCKSYMDARDAVCRNFLEEYGAGNFVRTAEAKFKTVRYFTCSALGHNHEGQPYEGKNVVDPVMWLLQQADSSIKAE